MKGHYLLIAVAVAGLLGLAFTLGRTGRTPVKSTDAETVERNDYDFTAQGVTVQQTDATGRLLYAFSARQVQQQANDSQISARDLTLHYDPPNESATAQRWTVRADTAQLPQQNGVLTVLGNVEARGTPPGSGEVLVIRTNALDYDMRGERLKTRESVRFEWNKRVLTGTGLDADLRSGKFKLESNVRGRVSF
jgi:LPS export ABC transporter protein LptC